MNTLKEKLSGDDTPVSRSLFAAVLDKLGPTVRTAIVAHIDKAIAPLIGRIAAIESRKGLEYRNTWRSDTEFGVNDLVTHSGQLWLCCQQGTRAKPGSSDAWRLVSKEDFSR